MDKCNGNTKMWISLLPWGTVTIMKSGNRPPEVYLKRSIIWPSQNSILNFTRPVSNFRAPFVYNYKYLELLRRPVQQTIIHIKERELLWVLGWQTHYVSHFFCLTPANSLQCRKVAAHRIGRNALITHTTPYSHCLPLCSSFLKQKHIKSPPYTLL